MRSHIDPCTFVAHLHISGDHLDAEFANAILNFEPQQGEATDELLGRLTPRSRQVAFHETYHYWQGLRLPFVYRYALLSFRNAVLAFRKVGPLLGAVDAMSVELPEFERLGIGTQIARGGPGILYLVTDGTNLPADAHDETKVSPLGLLECAASIAEFQVTAAGDLTDPVVLRRWEKRNPASLDIFWFVARFFSDERTALRLLLPLINASFHTNLPERAFGELLARAWGFLRSGPTAEMFLAQQEPCRWSDVCAMWLDQINFEATPDADAEILPSPFHRLTVDSWAGAGFTDGKGGSFAHPFLAPKARAWIELQKSVPILAMLIDQPGWVQKEIRAQCIEAFSPALSVYRFHLGSGNDRVVFTGSGKAGSFTSLPISSPSEWRGFVADMLVMYGAVRRISGAHYDNDQRTCHHIGCPHYGANLCNSYPMIPKNYEECGFPARLARLTQESR